MAPAHNTEYPFRVVVERRIAASVDEIFDAWLDDGGVGHWLFSTPGGIMKTVKIDPRPGGSYTIAEQRGDDLVTHFGEYREIDRPSRLVFTFSTDLAEKDSIVTVEISGGDGPCQVTLSHDMDPDWAVHEESIREGWTGILEGLDREVLRGL